LMREVLFDPVLPASVRATELGVAEKIPAGFDAWFARCVAREAARRFGSAAETASTFGQIVANVQPAGPPQMASQPSAPAPAPRAPTPLPAPVALRPPQSPRSHL